MVIFRVVLSVVFGWLMTMRVIFYVWWSFLPVASGCVLVWSLVVRWVLVVVVVQR